MKKPASGIALPEVIAELDAEEQTWQVHQYFNDQTHILEVGRTEEGYYRRRMKSIDLANNNAEVDIEALAKLPKRPLRATEALILRETHDATWRFWPVLKGYVEIEFLLENATLSGSGSEQVVGLFYSRPFSAGRMDYEVEITPFKTEVTFARFPNKGEEEKDIAKSVFQIFKGTSQTTRIDHFTPEARKRYGSKGRIATTLDASMVNHVRGLLTHLRRTDEDGIIIGPHGEMYDR